MYDIKNIKISIKIENLHFIDTSLKNIIYYNNFFVLKDKYSYIVFKPKKKTSISHVNITKIECFSKIPEAVKMLSMFFSGKILYNTLLIDNITATFYLPNNISLPKLYSTYNKYYKMKYNNDIFPGLQFQSEEKGTAIIFHNGKVNIVGCISRFQIEQIISTLEKWNASMITTNL